MMLKCTVVVTGAAVLTLAASAMPTKKELKGVQRLVNELMAGDIAAAKAGRMKPREVAADAEAYARDAETEAAKFLLLKGSFGYYMQGGEYGEALRVLDLLTASVGDVPDKVLAEIVGAKLKKLDRERGGEVFAYYERLSRRMSMGEERAKLEKALKENPKSKEAHGDLAVCLAVLGDWKGACAHFAEAGGREAEAAKLEASGKVAGAADLWWDLATGETEDAFKSHAAELYRAAIADGKLKGLKLTLVQKRIADFAPAGRRGAPVASNEKSEPPSPAAPDRRRGAPVASNEKSEPPSPATPTGAAPTVQTDWSLPAAFGDVRTIDLDLGRNEKMTFFAIPPGEAEIKWVGTSRISRPFWISQFPVTVGQLEAMGVKCEVPGIDKLVAACKSDPSAAALAMVHPIQRDKFFDALNRKYGRRLPKGLVFRPWTVAEQGRVGTFGNEARCICQLKSDEERRAYKVKARGWGALAPSFCFDFGRIRAARLIDYRDFTHTYTLDAISAPELEHEDRGHAPKCRDAVAKILAGSLKAEDPFWYCAKDAPARRYGTGSCVFQRENTRFRFFLRVAVGYDFVGEWMRQHGKK